ncbi:MAG: toprim domain-containing protein [Firmicutes bacterium]|nr:toprim domain-containing protein [Bacillota bacterium]MCM1401320.1 toprim domain-containing protein [Bacteroides sp.]MCM1477273.1 toprim domain-containing protein [Bacteroides sp.]
MIEENIPVSAENTAVNYTEDDIVTLDWDVHIRERPGMYIGNVGDGSGADHGIYVLLKEVLDNAIDEYMMGFGKQVEVNITESSVSVRDYGRGIPLGKITDAVSKINTGAKYDTKAFKKSIGFNGVGVKAVNALSCDFMVQCVRDGKMKRAEFSCGKLLKESDIVDTDQPNGTLVEFTPDPTIFVDYRFREDFVVPMLKNYTFLNTGLTIFFNGQKFHSRHGLLDLLTDTMTNEPRYPIIHLQEGDIEIAMTHAKQYGEEYYTFVNGQNTSRGGTHLTAFKEAVSRTVKEFIGKSQYEYSDIRNGIVAAVSIKVEDPLFDSQTKTRFGSISMGPDGPTVAKAISDFLKTHLDNYLHRNPETADTLKKIVDENERERKSMAGVTKKAREQAKKVNIHNKKLLDCRVHLNDVRGAEEKKLQSSIFITEGDSAAGSITKIRNVETQAVFSLRGKPKNTFGKTKRMVYENEEFYQLQAALNIEDSIDNLRYNKVIIATDADVDGMHIRMLLLTFFLQFFPDLVKQGHVYILETPLFRVRNKKTSKRSSGTKQKKPTDDTYYCYSDEERVDAIGRLGANAEITRFKGLGEISPEEFRHFIGEDMRAGQVSLHKQDGVGEMLRFYMGKNSLERQEFIINNLVVEDDSQIS